MDEKKLLDEEIVKALECCIDEEGCDCENCSYNNNDDCMHRNGEDLLDLIHRLQGEKAEYESKLADGELDSKDWHDEQVLHLQEENAEQKAEIERLTEKSAYQRLELCKEIAVLKKQVDKWTNTASKWFERELELMGEVVQAKQQVVKDTAKEILQEIFDEQFEIDVDIDENSKDDVVKVGKAVLTAIHEKIELMADRYGVEVE